LRPRDEGGPREARPTSLHGKCYRVSYRDGRKGPPAGNKARCNCTNKPQSKATQRKAKPNQTPTTQHTAGARDRPRQPQPRAERDHASGSGQRHARDHSNALDGPRGTRDTPNSLGAKRQRAEAKHKQTQATRDTPTRDRLQTHPLRSAKATVQQPTADNLRPPEPEPKRQKEQKPRPRKTHSN
jgi:hypothetical protein